MNSLKKYLPSFLKNRNQKCTQLLKKFTPMSSGATGKTQIRVPILLVSDTMMKGLITK